MTVICNLHSLEMARLYCDRLIGMAAGKVVFDGSPAMLTDAAAHSLYNTAGDDPSNTDATLSDRFGLPAPIVGNAVALPSN